MTRISLKSRLHKKRSTGTLTRRKSLDNEIGQLEDSSHCSPTSITDDSWAEEKSNFSAVWDEVDYDYEDAVPDVANVSNAKAEASTLAAKNDYGYEVAAPTRQHRISRRSSMKGANGPRPVRRSSLTFCEQVVVTPVVPTTELVKKKSELWLQSRDYDKIMTKAYGIADRVAEGTDQKHCTRGLETLLSSEKEEKAHEAYDAVLDEQWKQAKKGIYDENALSRVYRRSSITSKNDAFLRAQKDEKDVKTYTRDTRRFCRRMSM